MIETGEYEPVGSNETQICTARIIVASNWDLEEQAEKGKLSETEIRDGIGVGDRAGQRLRAPESRDRQRAGLGSQRHAA